MHSFRETQYFHPLAYTVIVALVAALGLLGSKGAGTGQLPAASVVLWMVSAALLLMVGALGRMVVEVDDQRLSIKFGWLGLLRRSIDLPRISSARTCLFNPVREYLGWGWRYGMDGSVCYTTRGRRGIEVIVDGQRHIVGCLDPRRLKAALLKDEEEDQPVLEPRAAAPFRLRRRPHTSSNWGMLRPGELGREQHLV